jgi:hypothetical protein
MFCMRHSTHLVAHRCYNLHTGKTPRWKGLTLVGSSHSQTTVAAAGLCCQCTPLLASGDPGSAAGLKWSNWQHTWHCVLGTPCPVLHARAIPRYRLGMHAMIGSTRDTACRWYLAQRYISSPLLIGGCKFGLRVWVLVPEPEPLRAYMHTNGLVLFSSERSVLHAH